MNHALLQRKAAERQRYRESGLVAVTVHIYPESRELLRKYVKRLNERSAPDTKDTK